MNLRRLVPRLALALLIAAFVAAAALNRERLDPAALDAWIGGLGGWSPIGYVAVYALATVAFVPGTVLGLAGGALFGPVWGTVGNFVGTTVGATLAFLVARYLAADWITRKAGGRATRAPPNGRSQAVLVADHEDHRAGDHHERRGGLVCKVDSRLVESRQDERKHRGRHHHPGGEAQHRVLKALRDPPDDEHRQRSDAGEKPGGETCSGADQDE